MRLIERVFFIIILFMLGIFNALAGGPPAPSPTGKKPPPPPGLPIDEHIFIAMIIAVLFGIYIIYSFKLKTETPI